MQFKNFKHDLRMVYYVDFAELLISNLLHILMIFNLVLP